MFILAHALADTPEPHAPLPHRAGLALAGVGPSITLAAACEVGSSARAGVRGLSVPLLHAASPLW